jgi:RNA polymerase sigma-70 factor (ECF subfamily)
VISRSASDGGPADGELVARVVKGDGAAFGLIVERYQDRLANAVCRLVGSIEDGRDVLQDTFVKAYENLDGFRGGSSLYTWLFRIAVNTSLSHRRKRKWMPVAAGGDAEEGGAAREWADPSAPDPADPLEAAETGTLVQEALSALDDEHRTVVVLRDIQHCDYQEISEILEIPTGTVKSRLHRARLMLREKLRPLFQA